MAKDENKTIIALISVAVLVILAIAFLTSISDSTLLNTQKTYYSETFDLSSLGVKLSNYTINSSVRVYPTHFIEAASGWRYDDETSADTGCSADDLTSSITAVNGTSVALADPTDYVRNTAGYITFVNTLKVNGTGNTTTITMPYCANGYMTSSWMRSVLNLNPGLYAIAILIAVVMVVYLLFGKNKDED